MAISITVELDSLGEGGDVEARGRREEEGVE